MGVATVTPHPRLGPSPATTPAPPARWSALGMITLGVGVAVVAVLGPLVTGAIRYHASAGAVNQLMGGDAVALLVIAPVAVGAGVLTWRGHPAGPVLGLGPALFVVYTTTQITLAADVARYPGNSERFFALFLGLFLVAASVVVSAWRRIDRGDLPAVSERLTRRLGVGLLVIAGFLVVGLHLPGLVDAWRDVPGAAEYVADPVLFWLVKLMDLGIVVPAMTVVAIGNLRQAVWVRRPTMAIVGWLTLQAAAVSAMAVVMLAEGDDGASVGLAVGFTLSTAAMAAVAVAVYRPLFGTRRSATGG